MSAVIASGSLAAGGSIAFGTNPNAQQSQSILIVTEVGCTATLAFVNGQVVDLPENLVFTFPVLQGKTYDIEQINAAGAGLTYVLLG